MNVYEQRFDRAVADAESAAERDEQDAVPNNCLNCGRPLPPDGDCYGCAADKAWADLVAANARAEVADKEYHKLSVKLDEGRRLLREAEAEAARLEKDKQRLDFLSCHLAQINLNYQRPLGETFLYAGKKTLRELIDIEMAERASIAAAALQDAPNADGIDAG